MTLNANQNAMRKGYAKIGKALGAKMDVFRAVQYNQSIIHPSNWQMERYISASINTGHQSNKDFGVPVLDGFFDTEGIETGDVFSDGTNTYIVGNIPLFEPAVVIQCFDTFTVSSRTWDKPTRAFVETVSARDVPCNIQAGSPRGLVRDSEQGGNSDSLMTWEIHTYLPQGTLSTNDVLVDSQGHKSQIIDLFHSQHGLRIRAVEIKE